MIPTSKYKWEGNWEQISQWSKSLTNGTGVSHNNEPKARTYLFYRLPANILGVHRPDGESLQLASSGDTVIYAADDGFSLIKEEISK